MAEAAAFTSTATATATAMASSRATPLPEITKEEAMEILLSNEQLSDLTLKSSVDGQEILAHRNLLGARSHVFFRMLYGDFTESSKSVIELPYSGKTLKALRDYIYTNSVPTTTSTTASNMNGRSGTNSSSSSGTNIGSNNNNSNHNNKKMVFDFSKIINGNASSSSSHQYQQQRQSNSNNHNNNNTTKEEMLIDLCYELVSIVDAATFFELSRFRERCETLAISEMSKHPEQLCLCFLAMCGQYASLEQSEIETFAADQISRCPDLLLAEQNQSILALLTYAQIEAIVRDPDILSDELTLFQIIQAWENSNSTTTRTMTTTLKPTISNANTNMNLTTKPSKTNNHDNGKEQSSPKDTTASTHAETAKETETSTQEQQEEEHQRNNGFPSRTQQAQQLTKHINLALIPPSKLVSIVAKSNLVTTQQLLDAFQTQALKAEREHHQLKHQHQQLQQQLQQHRQRGSSSTSSSSPYPSSPPSRSSSTSPARTMATTTSTTSSAAMMMAISASPTVTSSTFTSLRCPIVWETSETSSFTASSVGHSVEKLKCKVLTRGVFKWSIFVEETCDWSWLGVVSTVHSIQKDSFLGNQTGGWVVSSDFGYLDHASRRRESCLRFRKHSTVTFLLDLTKDGTLSAYVDGQLPPILLFSHMLSEFEGGRHSARFVPAVSLRRPGRVKFLGFE